MFFFFNDTATTEIYPLSLHDALPICDRCEADPSPEEQLDQAYPLHVFGPERLRRFAANEPERAPLAQLIRRRRRQLGKLLQGQLVPHRSTRAAWATPW